MFPGFGEQVDFLPNFVGPYKSMENILLIVIISSSFYTFQQCFMRKKLSFNFSKCLGIHCGCGLRNRIGMLIVILNVHAFQDCLLTVINSAAESQ